ncbi:DUF2933 domain-containing protein [Pyruvatibacter mobilis]|uniref:DUF2933 domain-containing protein n=1 Tax=Pyruvatibacter mobilis TaxID=1712261 RepID=UPI003BABF1B4
MAWLAENWVWVLIGIAFVAMHLFGHGGHGGHGGGGESSRRPRNENETDRSGQHRH